MITTNAGLVHDRFWPGTAPLGSGSRRFSSSSFILDIIEVSIPPNLVRHLWKVAVLMPYSLHKSGNEISDSTRLSASMIWLSVNRDLFISVEPLPLEEILLLSPSNFWRDYTLPTLLVCLVFGRRNLARRQWSAAQKPRTSSSLIDLHKTL